MEPTIVTTAALLLGFLLDRIYGDPTSLPHPVVGFGKAISLLEHRLNRGDFRLMKGAFSSVILVAAAFLSAFFVTRYLDQISFVLSFLFNGTIVFFCLAGLTLRKEVQMVFEAVDESTEKGRSQLSRIVGRDTSGLEPQQIRTGALETLAENLSDGVIAPLFWFALLGAPGMLAYKMVNTLDSMIGYKNERYLLFGRFAARLDDVVNYIPARITALIMLLVSGKLAKTKQVFNDGKKHASPNAGYPEAALAAILDCRFGGPNYYFGQLVEKPFIGTNPKTLGNEDLRISLRVNQRSEVVMAVVSAVLFLVIHFLV
ncbi:MAG: cobalamin biosynthesis protein CobD [Bacteroidales bacterium 45-6]|nr:MAG: cobalamin biosynthesis protein CobD [Bacteroidales bacterium 45-6]